MNSKAFIKTINLTKSKRQIQTEKIEKVLNEFYTNRKMYLETLPVLQKSILLFKIRSIEKFKIELVKKPKINNKRMYLNDYKYIKKVLRKQIQKLENEFPKTKREYRKFLLKKLGE